MRRGLRAGGRGRWTTGGAVHTFPPGAGPVLEDTHPGVEGPSIASITARTLTSAGSKSATYPPVGPGSERTHPCWTSGFITWVRKPLVVPTAIGQLGRLRAIRSGTKRKERTDRKVGPTRDLKSHSKRLSDSRRPAK